MLADGRGGTQRPGRRGPGVTEDSLATHARTSREAERPVGTTVGENVGVGAGGNVRAGGGLSDSPPEWPT